MELRQYRPEDCALLAQLFYDTVHRVNTRDYTVEQVDAWADGQPDLEAWNRSLLNHDTLVAQEQGQVLGFADVSRVGLLDRLYVHHAHQRQGVASRLCQALEGLAAHRGIVRLETHASITAKPFFEARGYRLVKEQQVMRHGVLLTNFVMEKYLDRDANGVSEDAFHLSK